MVVKIRREYILSHT